MRKIISLLKLTRPINVLIAMLSVFVAALISGTLSPWVAVLLAGLSAGLITAAANSINDYYDIAIDRINKPQRPLAAGRISPRAALGSALGLYAAGIALASAISPQMLAVAALFSLLTWRYSAHLKRTALWGNFAVSLSTAAAFIYGAMAVGRPGAGIFPALFAFFFHFGRESIKDMEDVAGDRQFAAHTFPVRYGAGPAIILVWVNFVVLVGLTLLPYFTGVYGKTYFLILLLGVYPLIGYVLFSIRRDSPPQHPNRLSNLLKADMLVGLLAIYWG